MKEQSIYTENTDGMFDEHDKLVPVLAKGSQVEIPKVWKPYNLSTRRSGAFNDFNPQFRKLNNINHTNKYRLPNMMGGNNAKGYYKHDTQDYFEKDETIKMKHRIRKIKETRLDPVENALQEQRDTEGTEIRGKETMLNKKRAEQKVKLLFKTKRNRGGYDAGKDGGAFSGGFAYTEYNNTQIKQDNKFKELNSQQEEFKSIIQGQQETDGLNSVIQQYPA